MKFLLLLCVLLISIPANALDIDTIAVGLNAKYSIPIEYTQFVLSKAKTVKRIKLFVTRVSHAPEKVLPYYEFEKFFVNKKRITDGVEFLKKHKRLFIRVYKEFGVDPCIIVAILSIETNLGREKLKYNCLNSLYTLAQFSRRSRYFLYELESFIVYSYKHKIDPFEVKGSITCAIGIPQFMPSNIDKYGVDFNGDGLNLNEMGDAVASVANYLVHMGWRKSKPVVEPCRKGACGKRVFCVQASKNKRVCFKYYKNFVALRRYNGTGKYALVAYELAKNICKLARVQ